MYNQDKIMITLLNAFSLNMLNDPVCILDVEVVSLDDLVRDIQENGVQSFIGHADTARILSGILNVPVAYNRQNVILYPGDSVVVAQYTGPRLPEGATELPTGAKIRFFTVEIDPI